MEYGVGTRVRSNCTVDAFISSSSSSVVVVDRAAQRETRAREKERKRERERENAPFFGGGAECLFFLNFFFVLWLSFFSRKIK